MLLSGMLMKVTSSILGAALLLFISGCAPERVPNRAAGEFSNPTVVEAACGQCLLELDEKKGCDLAVRFDGTSYFVDGFTMKQLGDAHADDGMCEVVRKALVTGRVENGRFVAATLDLLPVEE
jgi:hypothetical protein